MISRLLPLLAFILAAHLPRTAHGHEVRPAYLELRQIGADGWSVLWKVPALGEMRLSLHPRFPDNCSPGSEPIARLAGGAWSERSTIFCAGGLYGRSIGIDGLAATMTDVLVRLARLDGSVQVARLTPSDPAFTPAAVPGAFEVARTYGALGVGHILGGIDHLLFVLGLLLFIRDKWTLVKTISAFTVAHSMTLTAAVLGWVSVPQPPVEAVIALSILFLASELVKQRDGRSGLMERYPWIVSCTVGLLHGFGFAGALREAGIAGLRATSPLALISFNGGVEVGQLMFVGIVLAGLFASRRFLALVPAGLHALPAYGIGTVAAFWWMQRMAPLFWTW